MHIQAGQFYFLCVFAPHGLSSSKQQMARPALSICTTNEGRKRFAFKIWLWLKQRTPTNPNKATIVAFTRAICFGYREVGLRLVDVPVGDKNASNRRTFYIFQTLETDSVRYVCVMKTTHYCFIILFLFPILLSSSRSFHQTLSTKNTLEQILWTNETATSADRLSKTLLTSSVHLIKIVASGFPLCN
jgi:hypothetical protein